jgi:hypothetical protein
MIQLPSEAPPLNTAVLGTHELWGYFRSKPWQVGSLKAAPYCVAILSASIFAQAEILFLPEQLLYS